MTPVIVLDGSQKSMLAVVRSLGVHKIPLYVGAERSSAPALHSKYVGERFVYPSPYEDREAFIAKVKEVAKLCEKPPVVFCVSEVIHLTLYDYREELKDVLVLTVPPERSVEVVFDKLGTYGEAKVHGVPVIQTHVLIRKDEVERLGGKIEYPAVVKPRRSVSWKNGKGIPDTASFVHSKKELLERFFAVRETTGEDPLIQPLMKGEEYGYTLLVHAGEPFAEVAHHRIRSMSPTGGASVVKETVTDGAVFQKMREYVYTLTRELSWSGPIMFEFKVDEDTHEPYLMEINGRWVGSLPLSVAAGVDLPWLYYQYVTTGQVPEHTMQASPDTVSRHFLGDVRHLVRVLFSRDAMRPILYPSRRMAVRDFWRGWWRMKSDVWSWRDPMPFFWEYIDIFAKLK